MESIKAAQITCSVYRSITRKALTALKALGVRDSHLQASRAVVLRRRSGFLGIMSGVILEEEPADRIIFHVPRALADMVMRELVAACNLTVPGRGGIICEEVDIIKESAWEESPVTGSSEPGLIAIPHDLASITCTVAKGKANNIARTVLGLGIPMPQVTGGIGTGLRDKLGLVRIAIQAEKEVVHTIVSAHETKDIFDLLVDAGKIEQVGAGFIYASPVAKGIINSMVIRDPRYSASIEQLIAAVDDLKGTTNWRKRSFGNVESDRKHTYLHNLVNLTLICNEGRAIDLVRAAMKAGGSGATIGRLSYIHNDGNPRSISPAREMSELVVGEGKVEAITDAMVQEGIFNRETAGFIAYRPVSMACTHLNASR
jgi:hypothetical protein